jgi:hypothetical protein
MLVVGNQVDLYFPNLGSEVLVDLSQASDYAYRDIINEETLKIVFWVY